MAVLFKTLSGTIPANTNEITFTDSIINNNTIVEAYYNNNDVYTVETWQDGNTIGIVVSDHNVPIGIKVTLNNVNSFEPYDDTEVLSQLSSLSDDVSGLDGRLDNAEDDIDNLENDVDSLETALSSKQDTLTAGDNITIEDNVISANGGGIDYSLTEQDTGIKWINGKPIYQKTIDFGALPSYTTKTVNHGISNIENIWCIEAVANYSGIVYGGMMPLVASGHTFRVGARDTIVEVVSPNDDWSSYTAYITIRYTKTTD